MRLIDIDELTELMRKISGKPEYDNVGKTLCEMVIDVINVQPVVPAIPLPTLKAWMNRACEDDDLPMLYALDRILKRWEREHADGA